MILFWIAILTFTALDGSEALVSSRQQDTRAACIEMISGDMGQLMQRAIEEAGAKLTGAFCIPVTDEHRTPMLGGAPT